MTSPIRPVERAEVFKVPHHGSANAHSDAVWESMIAKDAIAIVTPLNVGRKKLPGAADLRRLLKLTPDVYVTGWGLPKRPWARASTVERMMAITTRDRRVIGGDMGHVRVTVSSAGSKDVAVSGPAHRASA